jgi:hypothetical protein
MEAELRRWMDERGYTSVDELRGSASTTGVADPSAYERANYLRTLHSWSAPDELVATAPSGEVDAHHHR